MTFYGVSRGHKVHIVEDGAAKARCKTTPLTGCWLFYAGLKEALSSDGEPRRCKVCFGLDEVPVDWRTCDNPAVLRGFIRALILRDEVNAARASAR